MARGDSGKVKPLFSWRGSICESDLPADTRHVALVLSMHMSERADSAFPSYETLAADTGRSKSTVSKALKELKALGWLTIVTTQGGRGRVNHYQGTVPQQYRLPDANHPPSGTETKSETVPEAPINGTAVVPEDVLPRGRKAFPITNVIGSTPPASTDPRVSELNGLYVTEHTRCFGFRPLDVEAMGKQIKAALAAGAPLESVRYAVTEAARDTFGVKALGKHLHLGAIQESETVDY